MEKQRIVAALEEMADLLEVRGENPFRVRSFRNGARAIEALEDDLAERVRAGTLIELSGIGKTLAAVVAELVDTGSCADLEELRAAVPAGVLELVGIPGIGPKKAARLHDELGIAGIDDLEKACRDGRIAGLAGFGAKTQEKILAGIAFRRSHAGRRLAVEAMAAGEPLLSHLRRQRVFDRLEVAGSLRRRCETAKDIDIVATVRRPEDAERAMESLVSGPGVAEVVSRGPTKASIRLADGLAVDLRVVPADSFAAALVYFSGSKEHCTRLRGLARELGFKLNEYGLFRIDGEREEPIALDGEEALYRRLGLDWIPPELREGGAEIDLAREHRLPDLVRQEDLRGLVHVHTTASDGANTLPEMVEAARQRGYAYLGVSDHSQSAAYAGGLRADAVRRQHKEIDRLNERLDGFRVFKGIESDIRADGSLDYPDDVLDRFDFVIASVHSGFQLGEKEQTARVLRAMEDPHTTFLGHPTGRLLLQREGYAIDMEKVLDAAGRLGVVVEINAHPRRLDLDWRLGGFARAHGVLTAVHPDAHEIAGCDDVVHGIGVARKAGFTAREVVNTYEAGEFAELIARRR